MANKDNARREGNTPAGFLNRYSNLIYFLLTACVSAAVYRTTLCPTVEFIDSGELAMACKYLGIAHPTGYPLYTAMGHLASMILWGELIHRVNLMSLIFTSLASGFLFLTILSFVSIVSRKSRLKIPAAISISLFAAFTPIWWAQGTTNEVYSLNLLLLTVWAWALFRYIDIKSARWLILSSYSLGLALTNHLSAIYMVPAFIFAIIYLWKRKVLNGKMIIIATAFFIFPLTIYLFLPIRARFKPFLNWGSVDDLYFLYKHISGWQYRIWMFSDFSLSEMLDKIGSSASLIYRQFGWIGLILALAGMVWTWIRKWYLFLFAALIIILNFVYASNYEIIDIESYYLPMIMAFAIFMAAGTVLAANFLIDLLRKRRAAEYAILACLIVLPVYGFISNRFVCDRSNKTFARQGVMDLADSMESGGLAIVENWDFYSPWLYLHFAENYRPDIVLLDKELMRRSWYFGFIKRNFPDIYNDSKIAIDEFLREVEPFERSRPFDSNVIDKAYYNMLRTIVINESAKRAVYTNVLSDKKFISGLPLVPTGILYKVAQVDTFVETGYFDFKESLWGNKSIYRDKRVAATLSYYKTGFTSREKYCRYFKHDEESDYYKKMTAEVSTVMSDIMNAQ